MASLERKLPKNTGILITGAAGFIGSAFARLALADGYKITVLDALTYAGDLANLKELEGQEGFQFVMGDIRDFDLVTRLLHENQTMGLVNFAAESHVDNSISGPRAFIETNILGTFQLLEASRSYLQKCEPEFGRSFRFVHVSTDEVFGSLGKEGYFSEATPYAPNSPYSASKAASDHLARAWFHTYRVPTIVTNCSNNYGPRQFPEKLIPLMIVNALAGKKLPVYGRGENIRDWIHVEDHAQGVLLALENGQTGGVYCFGGNSERKNIDVVRSICKILDRKAPRSDRQSYSQQIDFVTDRLGHDFRYAIDDRLAQGELGFARRYANFEAGLEQTVQWYLDNLNWVELVSKKKRTGSVTTVNPNQPEKKF